MENNFDKIKKYNIWDGKTINIGYQRKTYLDKIENYIGNKLIKVLVGQRRSGKSYIMRQLISKIMSEKNIAPANFFYLNKEYSAFNEIRTGDELENLFVRYINEIKPKGRIFIFLDEIQNIDGWESFVNSYSQDFTHEYEIFITGSNSKLLSGDLATLLSGRYVEFEIMPFSFEEIVDFKKDCPSRESFVNYIKTGGLPELLHISDEEVQRHYIESLKNTIILRDIIERQNVKDVSLLDDIFRFITAKIGNMTSISSIIKYFKNQNRKTNYETISSYISFLTESFIIHKADRFNLKGKRVVGGECKYYLNDFAFKSFLYGFTASDIGYYLENFVYNKLRGSGFNVSVGVFDNYEIDFIAKKGDKTIYIQVCYLLSDQKVIDREFGNLLKINDNYEKIVISLDDVKFSDYEGVKHLRPWELV
jgi:uncharacterized protein